MQIHELNNYNGNLDSSAYLAVDNGSDTGKVSTVELLADTNAAVSQLDTVLNGRIDNIVAGGEAPSTSEIVDARYGADGVTYPSLGAAIRDQVTDLKSDLDELVSGITDTFFTKEVGAVNTIIGKRVGVSDKYNSIIAVSENMSSIKIFPVKKGKKYKAYGFGYDRNSFYIGGISDSADIENTQTVKQKLLCGTDVYPDGYTYHYVEFVAEVSGYLSLTYRTAQTEAKLYESEYVPKFDAIYSHILIKNGDEYNYLCHAYGDIFASRIFKHCNANNLFQLYKIGYGTFDGINYTELQNVMTAITDIVGPVSIGRWNANTGYENGMWSGGNHTITVNNVTYKTAKETSFRAYCNGVNVTDAVDGIYFGDATFITENDLYFPQTITDDLFTDAIKAIHETRVYTLDNDMHVKVSLEMLYDQVGVMSYYGMQLQVPTDVVSIEIPSVEKLVKRSDGVKVLFEKPSNIYYLNTDSGWHYDMVLDDIGIAQNRKYVKEDDAYFNDYKFGNVVASFSKAYQQLIIHQHYTLGTLLTWSGTYKMYHD